MTDPEMIIARASRARALLEDPLLLETLTAMKAGIVEQFFSTPAEDSQRRELLHLIDRARQHFESALRAIILGGEIEVALAGSERQAADYLQEIQQRVRER